MACSVVLIRALRISGSCEIEKGHQRIDRFVMKRDQKQTYSRRDSVCSVMGALKELRPLASGVRMSGRFLIFQDFVFTCSVFHVVGGSLLPSRLYNRRNSPFVVEVAVVVVEVAVAVAVVLTTEVIGCSSCDKHVL